MGVDGLLKALQPLAEERVHVGRYKNKRVVIDGYTWLHKACYACAGDVVTGVKFRKNRFGRYPSFVEYCLHRLNLLKYNGAKPIMVFDGGKLVAKDGVEGKRDSKRADEAAKGRALMGKARRFPTKSREYRNLVAEANSHFTQAIRVTPDVMAITLEALRANNFDFIIAPYEADAQLAFELRSRIKGGVIISEDSDCIVYCLAAGLKCGKILFKMNREGYGIEIDLEKIFIKSTEPCKEKKTNAAKKKGKKLSSAGAFERDLYMMNPEMFLQMSVIAGCDYANSIKGIGIKKAQQLVLKFAKIPGEKRIRAIIDHIRKTDKTKNVPEGYEKSVECALLTFKHHWVCDKKSMKMVNLNPLPSGTNPDSMVSIIGKKYPDNIFASITKGYVHPRTLKAYDERVGTGPENAIANAFKRSSTYGTASGVKKVAAVDSSSCNSSISDDLQNEENSVSYLAAMSSSPVIIDEADDVIERGLGLTADVLSTTKVSSADSFTMPRKKIISPAQYAQESYSPSKSLIESPSHQVITMLNQLADMDEGALVFGQEETVGSTLSPFKGPTKDIEGATNVSEVMTPSPRNNIDGNSPLTQPTVRPLDKSSASVAGHNERNQSALPNPFSIFTVKLNADNMTGPLFIPMKGGHMKNSEIPKLVTKPRLPETQPAPASLQQKRARSSNALKTVSKRKKTVASATKKSKAIGRVVAKKKKPAWEQPKKHQQDIFSFFRKSA